MELSRVVLLENLLRRKVFITIQTVELTTATRSTQSITQTRASLHHTQLNASPGPTSVHPTT